MKVKKYMVGGIIQAGVGAAQLGYGIAQQNKSRKELEKIRAAAPALETPSEYFDLLKKAYDDNMMKLQQTEINRSLAGTTDALASAGGRALVGGINEATRGAALQTQTIAEQQRLRQQEALQNLAGAQERTRGAKEQRYQTDLQMENANMQAALGQIAGGASAISEGAFYTFASEDDAYNKKTGTVKKKAPSGLESSGAGDGAERLRESFKKENGGMITPGKFSHKDNPIHLVKDGKKVGEATGGEIVLNPKQAQKIAAESSFASKLFKKFMAKK